MDAQTVAAAALAVVIDESREAAVRELLLERERLAMAVADRDSFLAQRHFVVSAQVELPGRLKTWRDGFRERHNDFLDLLSEMRAAARAIRGGDVAAALSRLTDEVGSEDSGDWEADEEMDAEVEAVEEVE